MKKYRGPQTPRSRIFFSLCVHPFAMVSAGRCHTILLQSDGSAVACGTNTFGQCSIPPLSEGLTYTQASAGRGHTALLRSDGQVVLCGSNSHGQCNVPPLKEGISYIQVSAGEHHTVLLRSDGSAVVRGDNSFGQCNIPASKEGNSYVQVSAGPDYTMLLTSDGEVLRVGQTDRCAYWTVQVFVPNCEDACSRSITSCKQVSAGGHHMLVLHRSGKAQALSNFGYDDHGQCQIPALEEGVLYTQAGLLMFLVVFWCPALTTGMIR